jgi:TPR repeat protein
MIPAAVRKAQSNGPRIGLRWQNLLARMSERPIASQIVSFQVRPFRSLEGSRSIMLKDNHDLSLFTLRIQAFSTTQPRANSPNDSEPTQKDSNSGEAIYQQALEALQQVSRLEEEREKEKSQELHRAIEKAEAKEKEHAANPKAKSLKGVTVVKTVVKQTRKERGRISQLEEESSNWNQKAHNLLKEAAVTYGHPEALILLGNGALQQANAQWVDINDVQAAKQSVQKALDYYEMAGKNGSAEGWFNLGQLMWTGYPAKEEDDEEPLASDAVVTAPDRDSSMTAFRKSIELGDPDAMYFVGVQLLSQESSPGNDNSSQQQREGLELIESSASIGHGPALYYLALLHLNGNEALGICPCSPETFVDYLNAACSEENADALFLRGHSRHVGENGYPVDYAQSLQDFLAASHFGHADAAVSAGAMLHQGRPGVPRNQSQAFALYQAAGELGSQEGWRNVVACYALGEGVPRSEATARYIAKTMLQEDETEHA